ncbi:MAG: prolyl oligopeptidase family serine peptidase [Nitrososphaera sp.]|nr:prolyl oligopeptidase family serine peptidase [Nitrososphaera sp.]
MKNDTKTARFGSWRSPITTDMIVSEYVTLMEPCIVDDKTYWIEVRPYEGGRFVIVRQTGNGHIQSVTPPSFSARTLVHEYGGGSYVVYGDSIFFCNFTDQRIYRQTDLQEPAPITQKGAYRYADAIVDRPRDRLVCVREDHSNKQTEPANSIVSICISSDAVGESLILVEGADFYSSPRLSAKGDVLAWVSWSHPNMPWDRSTLSVAGVDAVGAIGEAFVVAGGSTESVLQPEWADDGTLYFLSDRSGWWNLYRFRDGHVEPVVCAPAEFGGPHWLFRESYYCVLSDDKVICTYKSSGVSYLAVVDTVDGRIQNLELPLTSISYLRANSERAVFLGASPEEFPAVMELNLNTKAVSPIRRSSVLALDQGYLSVPQAIEFPTDDGMNAHGFFYPPVNKDYLVTTDGELPPLIVIMHGGPTSACDNGLKLTTQYWTSRGFAILDVNYRGSVGFGRKYRELLYGNWGVSDVHDCVGGAQHLADIGLVDKTRLIIRGGSAGGYTALSALSSGNIFRAGASYAGVSDLEIFIKETHKFESHYLDKLIGPYPECRELYRSRSPINSVEKVSCPVIFFQGVEDQVVLPSQAEKMFEALRNKGIRVAYVTFEGEQHGFRKASSIKRSLEAELYFYSVVFGFELGESVTAIPVYNL